MPIEFPFDVRRRRVEGERGEREENGKMGNRVRFYFTRTLDFRCVYVQAEWKRMAELLHQPNACLKVFYNSCPCERIGEGTARFQRPRMKFENLKLIRRIRATILSPAVRFHLFVHRCNETTIKRKREKDFDDQRFRDKIIYSTFDTLIRD